MKGIQTNLKQVMGITGSKIVMKTTITITTTTKLLVGIKNLIATIKTAIITTKTTFMITTTIMILTTIMIITGIATSGLMNVGVIMIMTTTDKNAHVVTTKTIMKIAMIADNIKMTEITDVVEKIAACVTYLDVLVAEKNGGHLTTIHKIFA